MTAASPQAVFLEHENWLRTVVRSRLSEADAVEDVMQNIALAIVKNRDSLAGISKTGAWLYQIAIRQVLMYRRSRGRRRRMEDRLLSSSPQVTETDSPMQAVIVAETQDHVRKALGQMSELDRQILMLKYTEGWTYRELAGHLGVHEDTIEYRLLKARKNLRRLLAKWGEDAGQ